MSTANMGNLLKCYFVLSGLMASLISAQLPSSNNGFLPSPYYFYNPATLTTQKTATVANPIINHDSNYHDYPTPALLGSHVVFLTTCLKELKESNQKLTQTSKLLEEIKNAPTTLAVENFIKELAGNTQRLEEMAKQFSVVRQDVDNTKSKMGELKTELAKSTTASSIGKIPASCGDLEQIGHKKSGLFSIMGSNKIETVYCDFTKASNDSAAQKKIGYADVKSLPTVFYVQKTKPFSTLEVPIPYETERLNIGGAMNRQTGIFTAPRNGVYFFSFSGVGTMSGGGGYLDTALTVNGKPVAYAECNSHAGGGEWQTYTLQSTIDLKAGDKVWVQILHINKAVLFDDNRHYTHFNGWMLLEDVSQ